jgi:hypothetical protein
VAEQITVAVLLQPLPVGGKPFRGESLFKFGGEVRLHLSLSDPIMNTQPPDTSSPDPWISDETGVFYCLLFFSFSRLDR